MIEMIIEKFTNEPTRCGYGHRFDRSKPHGFFIEFILEDPDLGQYNHYVKTVIDLICWVERTFGEFNENRVHINWRDEFSTVIIQFRDEADAFAFVVSNPFNNVTWTNGENSEELGIFESEDE